MLFIAGKGRGGICHFITIHWYMKASNKHMKDYDRLKNHHILSTETEIIYIDKECHKSCL